MIVFTSDADPPDQDRTDAMTQALRHPGHAGARVVVAAAAATLGLGLLLALAGWAVSGGAAALGALVGVLLVVVVSCGGVLLVDAVARLLPWASLLVALLTYTLQLLVVLVAFVALERSDLLGPVVDRGWIGGAAIGAVLVSLAAQVVMTVRARIPAYDLPEGGER